MKTICFQDMIENELGINSSFTWISHISNLQAKVFLSPKASIEFGIVLKFMSF